MKSNHLAFRIIFALVILIPVLGEQRNLSTPLSRLVGHWKDNVGTEWYFSKPSEEQFGSLIRVYSVREIKNMLGNPNLKLSAQKRQIIEEGAGKAFRCEYAVATQEPAGEQIEIEIRFKNPRDPDLLFREHVEFFWEEVKVQERFCVKKDGKRTFFNVPFLGCMEDDALNALIYMDQKTSPEDIK